MESKTGVATREGAVASTVFGKGLPGFRSFEVWIYGSDSHASGTRARTLVPVARRETERFTVRFMVLLGSLGLLVSKSQEVSRIKRWQRLGILVMGKYASSI